MVAWGAAILAAVGLAMLVFLHTLVWLTVLSIISLVFAIVAVILFNSGRPIAKDLRLGQKQMIRGAVEAQNVDVKRTKNEDGYENAATYRWWIMVSGKKITVTEDQYYQFKKGDIVEAYVTPHSGTVLGLSRETRTRPFRT
jgi:uncharacterized protein (DUF58 family)